MYLDVEKLKAYTRFNAVTPRKYRDYHIDVKSPFNLRYLHSSPLALNLCISGNGGLWGIYKPHWGFEAYTMYPLLVDSAAWRINHSMDPVILTKRIARALVYDNKKVLLELPKEGVVGLFAFRP